MLLSQVIEYWLHFFIQVARCTKIINPNTEDAKYVINVKQIAKVCIYTSLSLIFSHLDRHQKFFYLICMWLLTAVCCWAWWQSFPHWYWRRHACRVSFQYVKSIYVSTLLSYAFPRVLYPENSLFPPLQLYCCLHL